MLTKAHSTIACSQAMKLTAIVQGMGEDKGLAGLFDRVGNLGKGVVIGNTVGMLWGLRIPHWIKDHVIMQIWNHVLVHVWHAIQNVGGMVM